MQPVIISPDLYVRACIPKCPTLVFKTVIHDNTENMENDKGSHHSLPWNYIEVCARKYFEYEEGTAFPEST